MSSRRVAILFNPISGSGRARLAADEAGAALRACGHEVRALATSREAVAGWLTPALAECDVAVVAGGDGAMRLVAPHAAAASVPIYHYPAGTENLFARHVGIRPRPEQLCAAVEAMRVERWDLGQLTADGVEESFLLMASAGFDAEVVHGLAARRRGAISRSTYGPAIARQVFSWRPPTVAISIDGAGPTELGQGILIVANAPTYGFGIDPGRGANPCDGALDVVFLPCGGGIGAMAWAARLLLTKGRPRGARRFCATRLAILTERPARWQLDGDPAGPAEGLSAVSIALRPGAVPVLTA